MSSHEQEIFIGALELPEDSRAPFLAAACADDPALRSRVESLLRAAAGAGRFLGGAAEEVREGPGACIGPYRLVARLGEGGFGVVYQAEQETPVRRPVALKIIKLGMDTRAVIARFAAERQALALMEHPHIAHVLDAGATATGRPYFVMELVSGTPLTTYCREHRLTVRARLELFLQVCRAIHHAHQRGVIHRDLKPSNVLVARDGERPVAKVIDFGIAKATREPLTEHTVLSRLHLFVGTPDYMSPEQLGLGETDVDTRSDIYSLGALLYELLTETPPLDTRTAPGYTELEGLIRRVEPRPPSQRLAALPAETQQAVATNHRTTPPRLRGELRGDLDQIILKCLEKDRTRRYETTDELARDIQRYLADEPVLARPATLRYRLGKFVRRHRNRVVASLFVAALLLSLSIYYAQSLKAERDRARLEAGKARKVSELIASVLSAADPFRSPNAGDATIQGVLANVVERAHRELAQEPDVRAEILNAVGRVYLRVGRHPEAKQALSEALAAGRTTGVRDGRLGQTLNDLGVLERELGQNAAAIAYLTEALEIRRALHPEGDNDVAATLVELGRVLRTQELFGRAETLLSEALEIRRRVLGEHRETATSMSDLGLLYWQVGKLDRAEGLLRECLAMTRRTLGQNHPNTAFSLANLALLAETRGDYAQAETLAQDALAVMRRTMGEHHWRTARFMAQLAGIHSAQGRHAEAARLLDAALEADRQSLGAEHLQTISIEIDRARAHLAAGEAAQAVPLLEHALPVFVRAYPEKSTRVAVTNALLGVALAQLGRDDEAEKILTEAVALMPELPGVRGAEKIRARAALEAIRNRKTK